MLTFGFEVQIDQLGQPDGVDIHRTGAIYCFAGRQHARETARRVELRYEITVQGQHYTVKLNGASVTDFQFVAGSDAAHPDRGLPTTSLILDSSACRRIPGGSPTATFRSKPCDPLTEARRRVSEVESCESST